MQLGETKLAWCHAVYSWRTTSLEDRRMDNCDGAGWGSVFGTTQWDMPVGAADASHVSHLGCCLLTCW